MKKELNFDAKTMENNLVALYNITHTRMRKFFPSIKRPVIPVKKRPWVPYVSDELLEFAERELQVAPKEVKKLFKKLKFTAQGGFGRVYVAQQQPENKKSKQNMP